MFSWPSAVDAVEKAGELGVGEGDRGSLGPSCASAAGGRKVFGLDDDVFAESCSKRPCQSVIQGAVVQGWR